MQIQEPRQNSEQQPSKSNETRSPKECPSCIYYMGRRMAICAGCAAKELKGDR